MTQRSLFCHHHHQKGLIKGAKSSLTVLIFQLYSRCRSIRWGWNLLEYQRIRQGEKIQVWVDCQVARSGNLWKFPHFVWKAVYATLNHVWVTMVWSQTYFTELRGWWLVTPTHTLQLFQVGRHICQINCWEKEAQTKTTTTIITKETLQHMRWWSAQNGTSSPASITKGASPKKEL